MPLADVYRREHEDLVKKGVAYAKGKFRKATAAEIKDSAARHAASVEDGDWIEVKRELTAGESRNAFSRLVNEVHFNEPTSVKPEQIGLAKMVEYLVAWSVCGPDGAVIPLGFDHADIEAALLSLDVQTFGEIEAAVDAHEAAIVAARTARKNDQGDATKSSETSLSVA